MKWTLPDTCTWCVRGVKWSETCTLELQQIVNSIEGFNFGLL